MSFFSSFSYTKMPTLKLIHFKILTNIKIKNGIVKQHGSTSLNYLKNVCDGICFSKIRAIVNFTEDFFLGNFPIFLEELFGIAPLGKCVY